MPERMALALVLHNHQPVGNFGWVIEDVWAHAYAPLLEALERHPQVRLGLHYSGPLLEWIAAQHAEAIAHIRALVDRGQVELLGGGLYEPILVSLPVRDRHAQLAAMADRVEALFGRRPRGAWLAERVWEPSLASDLAGSGYAYTVLDDNHLRAARVAEDAMWGTYSTDDQGRRLTILGTEQGLRYRIPWAEVDEVIDYLRTNGSDAGARLGVMGDDGEKFGAWPGTWEHCWTRDRWVERFFGALEENASWLSTVRPSDWLEDHPPLGRIYVPASSYVEMTEWALPVEEAGTFHDLLADARAKDAASARFLFGAMWRNFQSRYREVNDLHKQMLRASDAVAAMAPGTLRDRAADHLARGQTNDVYWHGLFGGVYLVHLRVGVAGELIAAQDLASGGRAATCLADLDLDGRDEALLGGDGHELTVDLDEGAGIGAWDLYAPRVALGSVLRRRPEAYHARLRAYLAGEGQPGATSGVANPHEAVIIKDPGLDRLLVYDRHEQRGALVTLRDAAAAAQVGPAELAAVTDEDVGDFVDQPFAVVSIAEGSLVTRRDGHITRDGKPSPISVIKTFRLGGDRQRPELRVDLEVLDGRTSGAVMPFELDLSFAWNLSGGGHNPAAWYTWSDGAGTTKAPHDTTGDLAASSDLAFGNDDQGVRVDLALDRPARLTWYPVETVSNSEAGFEKVYQGSSLHLRWAVEVAPGGSERFGCRFLVTSAPVEVTLS